mgnify:CR=1 FL=1
MFKTPLFPSAVYFEGGFVITSIFFISSYFFQYNSIMCNSLSLSYFLYQYKKARIAQINVIVCDVDKKLYCLK